MIKRISKYLLPALFAFALTVRLPSVWAASDEILPRSSPGFGLNWVAKKEIEAAGVTLTKAPTDSDLGVYTATHLPKTVADIDTVILFFNDADKLVKVAAFSKTMKNDYYGTEARSRIDEIAKIIEDNYSIKPEKLSRTDKYYGGDDYAYGIQNEKNFYMYLFQGENITIGLKLMAPSMGDLYYSVEYEKKPEWEELLDRRKDKEKTAF